MIGTTTILKNQVKLIREQFPTATIILISGYDCELYDILGRNGFTKVSFDVKTTSGNFKPKTKTEYLYYNY